MTGVVARFLDAGVEPDGHDVVADPSRAVHATGDEVVCVDRAGAVFGQP